MSIKLLTIVLGVGLCLGVGSVAAHAAGLDDAIGAAEAEGLPVDGLRNKVREGRAKRVPEARIEQVVRRLAGLLREEHGWLQQAAEGPHKVAAAKKAQVPRGLWMAVAEARLSGVSSEALRAVVTTRQRLAPADVVPAMRRIDALVDLQVRGYPVDKGTVGLVRAAALQHLDDLGTAMDSVRRQTGLTHAEVLDRVAQNMRRGEPVQAAIKGVRAGGGGAGMGAGAGGSGAGRGSGGPQGAPGGYRGGR